MSDPENDKQIQKRGPKHIRLRYYTSHEEATIVKLWREHFSQITSYTENLQIFRDISFGLQHHGVRLNKQEVRRRINSYRNKYLVEHSRLESDSQYKSPWRLYPLIDILFQPTGPSTTQTEHQFIEQIASKIRKELPSLPRYSRHDCRTLKFEQDANGCPFLDGQQSMPPIKSEQLVPSAPVQLLVVKTEPRDYEEDDASQSTLASIEKRSPLTPANRILEHFSNSFDTGSNSSRRIRRRSFMPRTGQITLAQIEKLRKENELLAEQRDDCLKTLELKERQYRQLEQTFDLWLHQQNTWMTYLVEHGTK